MARQASKRASRSTGAALLQVMMLLARGFSANLKRDSDGLEPAQMRILMRLAEGPCSLTELAEFNAVKPPTVSRSVNVLAKAGLIRRTVPEDNRRVTLLALTPAGRKKLGLARKKAEAHVGRALAPLNSQERQQVDAALVILNRILSA